MKKIFSLCLLLFTTGMIKASSLIIFVDASNSGFSNPGIGDNGFERIREEILGVPAETNVLIYICNGMDPILGIGKEKAEMAIDKLYNIEPMQSSTSDVNAFRKFIFENAKPGETQFMICLTDGSISKLYTDSYSKSLMVLVNSLPRELHAVLPGIPSINMTLMYGNTEGKINLERLKSACEYKGVSNSKVKLTTHYIDLSK